jgi:beta-lactamase regulating signal transducer with metallopeptidase domain/uncharacterized membrane protein YkoI
MRTSSEFLLTVLLNACWQILLITALASLGSWLLRSSSARYRHWLWVGALLLSFLTPPAAAARIWLDTPSAADSSLHAAVVEPELPFVAGSQSSSASSTLSSGVSVTSLHPALAVGLIVVYLGFVLFSCFRLFSAWSTAQRIKQTAEPVVISDPIAKILERCQKAIGVRRTEILSSSSVPVPVTMGVVRPVIILPEQLLREGDSNLLTSAIAHEAIHVARRDYVLNLFYELIYLSLSFHPAAALIRRRIKQTRELSCDELVAQRVLEPEIYARSLVTLASSAPPLHRLSATATVGIADADILEVRIMSLMKKSKINERSRKILLIVVALLLAVPSATAVAFAMRFDVEPLATIPQEQEKEKEKQKEKERQKLEGESQEFRQGERAGEMEALKKRIQTLDPERVAEREALQKRLERLSSQGADEEVLRRKMETVDSEYEARKWRIEEELKARNIMHAALIRMARIPMDQAIQIALSQHPGKVIQSSLGAKSWEEPGKLAKDGQVFYHVIVASGDEDSPTLTHIWVDAINGTLLKVEKELPRKMREQP